MFPGGNTGVARHILKQLNLAPLVGGASMAGSVVAPFTLISMIKSGSATRVRLNATGFGEARGSAGTAT